VQLSSKSLSFQACPSDTPDLHKHSGQCGGTGFAGSTCCASGSTCVETNEYYSQCLVSTDVTTTAVGTTAATTTAVGPTSTKATTTTLAVTTTTQATAAAGSGTATWAGNPFSGVSQWANKYYASEVAASAVPSLGAKATAVAEVPSFMWLDTYSKIELMEETLADIRTANAAGGTPNAGIFVVYDLPDRDCAAAASNGEYSIADNGVANYKAYIDAIVSVLKTYSDIRVILVIGQSPMLPPARLTVADKFVYRAR
jgi:cellulose 1,4-beta-cellobiosidase